MQEQVDKLVESHEKNSKVLDDIHQALCGTPYGQDGLITRVERTEKYQRADKKQKWMIAGAVATLSAGFAAFKFWVSNFFS